MGVKPNKDVTRRRDLRIWELRTLHGYKLEAIRGVLDAEGLGPMSFQGVFAACKRVNKTVLAEMVETVEEQKEKALARYEHMFGEAIQAWERSKDPVKLAREKRTDDGPDATGATTLLSARVETTHEVRDREGDPRYLAEARAALEGQRKLLGLDAPVKAELGGIKGAPAIPITIVEVVAPEGYASGN